jgi:hypothetical protein
MTAELVLKGLEFAHPKGSAPQLLDLYLPTGAAGFRGRTCGGHVHGGGWRVGRPSSLGPQGDALGLRNTGLITAAYAIVFPPSQPGTSPRTLHAWAHNAFGPPSPANI